MAQNVFDYLSLEEDVGVTTLITTKVFLGKLLECKAFKKHMVKEIISQICNIKGKVLIKELSLNSFQFTLPSRRIETSSSLIDHGH